MYWHQLLLFILLSILPAVNGEKLSLTEAELLKYDGSDEVLPIYLAINRTIYDVTASPKFYGPGGNYHHLVARDATRAWVTECWDDPDQLTWRMDDVEKMFMSRYLDEELEKVAGGGKLDLNLGPLLDMLPAGQIADMAKKALHRVGKVSAAEKKARREQDKKDAKQGVHDALAHWIKFFANNDKYKVVGEVILDEENTPPPPPLCDAAMEKRPINGGLLDSMVDVASMGKKLNADAQRNMPDMIKQMYGKQEPVQKSSNKDEL